ncbi:MAG: DUF3015 family protein [Methylococcales bacterium]|jgi:hypothetical protein|nr:DUF3015 family protein [Methylococcales bacterium]MBT7410590.1 DUF3015 family protein [Methylococcales bacterium]
MQTHKKILSLLFLIISTQLTACAVTEVTSTTSGAVDTVTPDITLNSFVNDRYIAIRSEAARGYGEHLDVLAQMTGTDHLKLSQWMKQNYNQLFSSANPQQLIQALNVAPKINT